MAAKKLKVAIVHDWLVGGGAERVVYELHRMYPDAPIYTSYATDEWRKRLDGKVVTGYLQRWPFSRLRKFIGVLRIWWFTHLDFSAYDLVISSSGNGEAKGIRVPGGTTHISYCHTPTHFYWRHYEQYLHRPGFGIFDPLARAGLRLLVGPLRAWDLKASKRPDYLIANSTHIQSDIQKYYGRESVVIHPPIDIKRFEATSSIGQLDFVTVGRQVPAKHTDIIVKACTKLGLPLIVVGNGPEHEHLKRMAGPTITFAPPASDEQVAGYMSLARGFIFASFDDFGITPIEALASGTPLITYKAGGALDYAEEGRTGVFFKEQTVDSLTRALRSFDPKHFKPETLRRKAEEYSPEVFQHKMYDFITSVLTKRIS
jgi:glycosyltransferase involved in cell wall biosynthesis